MSDMRLTEYADGFDLTLDGKLLLRHHGGEPALFLGTGEPAVRMNHGHFRVTDYVSARVPLTHSTVSATKVSLAAGPGGPPLLELHLVPGAVEVESLGTANR